MPSVLEEGERVHIRRVRAEDEQELCTLRRDSWEFLAPWEPWPVDMSPHGSRWFQRFLSSARRPDAEKLLVVRRDDGVVLGNVNLSQIVRGAFLSGILGYWIGAAYARQGFMQEGLELVLRHAFGTLGLHRVEANIRPENEASLALVRRAGFAKEGFSPRYLHIAGEWRDHERWALLVEDWRQRT